MAELCGADLTRRRIAKRNGAEAACRLTDDNDLIRIDVR